LQRKQDYVHQALYVSVPSPFKFEPQSLQETRELKDKNATDRELTKKIK
jgi:hypothetical protein